MPTDYKKLALESLKFIREISDNEGFPSSIDGSEIDIDKEIHRLSPVVDDVHFLLRQIEKGKEHFDLAFKSIAGNMKILIMHYMNEKDMDELIIEDLDVIHSDSGISAGDYMDSVTKVLSNGNFFYTHNGDRNDETEGGEINSLSIKSLDKIIKLLQD